MGFHRITQPESLDRERISRQVAPFVAQEIAFLDRTADPFHLADPCPMNGHGPHGFIGSCGDIVCCYCQKVVWQ